MDNTIRGIALILPRKVQYVRVKALPRACVQKIQYEGGCREANTARGKAECCICLETPPKYYIFRTHKQGGALSVILYFLVIWLGAIFSSIQTATIFGDMDISMCSYIYF